ncbi:hypothetical protein K7711_40160 [Nocardia sp. CA2R105]|uniref:hypothetical protein n=1 Tax=Nocardia coffeae TaxID=2873381 RepID=UPI001CA5FE9A|nr:hypothetical protein [Nocardia coffeae]MBY8862739.1 hypothetical protein [Nocardia coffeae]
MTEPDAVTVPDTIRWLHEEGLIRLAGVADSRSGPIAAYTVEVATGMISAHPATGAEEGSDVMTLAAEDLPYPVGTPKRLVIVGVTTAEAVLVVDLASSLAMSINGDKPETAARSWAMQLLLNPEISLTTNSAAVAIKAGPRFRQSFIPGSGSTIIQIDDRNPPVTTITLNARTDGPDHLDIAPGGTGEMYLGARFWELRQVMTIDDDAWAALDEQLTGPAPGVSPGPGFGAESHPAVHI